MSNVISFNSAKKPQLIKPVSVFVEWSESNEFEDEKTYDFLEFEQLALKVALTNPDGHGYDKTSVVVKFDNDDSYACRLDLSCNCDAGFLHHLKGIWAYFNTLSEDDYSYSMYKQNFDFAKKVDFSLVDLDTVNQALAQANEFEKLRIKQEEELKQIEREQERERQLKEYEVFKAGLLVPDDAKAVIVAYFTEYDHERSDPYADYHTTKTTRCIILAWSKHTRDLFSEMRKAAKNHPDTLLLSDKEHSIEHREKYSMGAGYYLTDLDYIRAGIEIKKITFYGDNKVDHVPFGEMAIPNYEAKEDKPEETAATDSDHESGIEFASIQHTIHSKKGHDLFVVVLANRVEYGVYEQVLQVAKDHGGYYSSFNRDGAIAGFQFLTQQAAQDFINHFHHDSDEEPAAPPAIEEDTNSELVPEKANESIVFTDEEKTVITQAVGILVKKVEQDPLLLESISFKDFLKGYVVH